MFVLLQSKEGMPMRFPTGVSRDRFNLITAVLAKHARLKVSFTYSLQDNHACNACDVDDISKVKIITVIIAVTTTIVLIWVAAITAATQTK